MQLLTSALKRICELNASEIYLLLVWNGFNLFRKLISFFFILIKFVSQRWLCSMFYCSVSRRYRSYINTICIYYVYGCAATLGQSVIGLEILISNGKVYLDQITNTRVHFITETDNQSKISYSTLCVCMYLHNFQIYILWLE